ncbi:peroxidasin homolog [Branchiostoma floridae]|uniref:Peroxidasin homolog n=1 Tax=Branchiostoma floridae TaxID=7739 RepID=A0A9J7LRC4_BRAFL|nr:peroxidasin homolog [Branchiostoma floridae]
MERVGALRYSLVLLVLLPIVNAAFYRTRPQSTGVLVNQTVTLYCAFNGLGPSEVVNWYWYNPETDDKLYHISARGRVASEFSRHSIVGSSRRGEYNLRIRDVQPADEGNYRCSVFTVRDAGDARLTVVDALASPPSIAGNRKLYNVGEELRLKCRSEGGKPLARLKWYNGTKLLKPTEEVKRTEPTGDTVEIELHILFLTRWENGANITCLADQGVPGVSPSQATSVQLHVLYPPAVIVPERSVVALEGRNVSLSCLSEGNPPADVTWRRDGAAIPQDVIIRNSSLLIPRVSQADGGSYLCEADNGIGPTGTGQITMEVIFPPKIKPTFDQEISVLYGQDVFTVECSAEGNPKPGVSWRRRDTYQPYDNPLTLSPLNYQTEGVYVCVAKSNGFPEITRETYINVIGRPEVVSEPASVSAAGGDMVKLTCTIASDPLPDDVIWELSEHDGKKLEFRTGKAGRISVTKTIITANRVHSALVITSAESAHTGEYACTAANMFGKDRQQFSVYVTEGSSDVLLVAAVTIGVVLGIVFAVLIVLCLRARKMPVCCFSDRGTRSCALSPCCSRSNDGFTTKPPLDTSLKITQDLTATLELQKLNGISKQRSTISLDTVGLSSQFQEAKKFEYGSLNTHRRGYTEDTKYQRHCPYYIGELTLRQESKRSSSWKRRPSTEGVVESRTLDSGSLDVRSAAGCQLHTRIV